jgi:hypothetical protein
VVIVLSLAACRREDSTPLPDKVVAVVEETIISPEALVGEVLRQGYTNSWDDAVEFCLEELIRSEVAYAKARDEGFDRSPQVQAAIRSNLPPGALTESNPAMRDAVSRQIVVSRFLETHLGLDAGRLQISDSEIQDYFRKNPNEFSTPPMANGAMLFVRVPADSSAATLEVLRKRAESLHARALQQKDLGEFAALASQSSEDPVTRNAGGEMGWVGREATNQWPEPVLQALFALRQPGDISPLVTTAQGFYVLRLIKHRLASVAEWAVVRERIRAKLAEQKEAERAAQYFASLKKRLHIRVNRDLVEAVKQQLKTNTAGAQTIRDTR